MNSEAMRFLSEVVRLQNHELYNTERLNWAAESGVAVQRRHFGNLKISVIDADFIHGPGYQMLSAAAATFKGLTGPGALLRRGQGDKAKEIAIKDFHEAMNWLRDEAERGVDKQRYKGLGEMNPEQL